MRPAHMACVRPLESWALDLAAAQWGPSDATVLALVRIWLALPLRKLPGVR